MSETLTTKSPADMTPVEVDTELARIYDESMKIEARIVSDVRYIERQTARANKAPLKPWDQKSLEDAKTRLADYQAKRLALIAESAPYQHEFYTRGGWNRYYRVTNANGHVHRETNCSTCYPTTEFAWVFDLADCDEAQMVEEFGEKACTVCFPNAPALPSFNGPGRRNQEAKDAKAAERQARADAKAAKAITAPDGSPLHIKSWSGTERIDTERAARIEASDAWLETTRYAEGHSQPEVLIKAEANLATIVEAIAAKHGLTTEEVLADMQPSFDRKLKTYRKECAEAQRRFGHLLPGNQA